MKKTIEILNSILDAHKLCHCEVTVEALTHAISVLKRVEDIKKLGKFLEKDIEERDSVAFGMTGWGNWEVDLAWAISKYLKGGK